MGASPASPWSSAACRASTRSDGVTAAACGAIDQDVRRRARRHRDRRPVGPGVRRPRPAPDRVARPVCPPGRRRPRDGSPVARSRLDGSGRHRAVAATHTLGRWTWSSRCSTAVGRGRHHQGMLEMAGVRYVGAGCSPPREHGQGVHEGGAGRRRAASAAVDHRDARQWERDQVGCREAPPPSATRCSPNLPAGVPASGSPRCTTPVRAGGAIEEARYDPGAAGGLCRRRPARSSAGSCRRSTGPRRPACPRRSGSPGAGSTTSPRSTSRRSTPSSTSRRNCRTTSPTDP